MVDNNVGQSSEGNVSNSVPPVVSGGRKKYVLFGVCSLLLVS